MRLDRCSVSCDYEPLPIACRMGPVINGNAAMAMRQMAALAGLRLIA